MYGADNPNAFLRLPTRINIRFHIIGPARIYQQEADGVFDKTRPFMVFLTVSDRLGIPARVSLIDNNPFLGTYTMSMSYLHNLTYAS
jgi:hypothetical protein